MIPINNNLEDIIEKIERLADKIEVTKDEDLLYVYLRAYKAYCPIIIIIKITILYLF